MNQEEWIAELEVFNPHCLKGLDGWSLSQVFEEKQKKALRSERDLRQALDEVLADCQ